MNPDVVIVGGGIAGLTAGIFASRAGLNAILIDNQGASGGVLINVDSVQEEYRNGCLTDSWIENIRSERVVGINTYPIK